MKGGLDCRRAEELLSDDVEGTLDSLFAQDLAAHLESCPQCRALRAALVEVVDVLRADPGLEPSRDLAERVATAALRARTVLRMKAPSAAVFGLPPRIVGLAAVLTVALSAVLLVGGTVSAGSGRGTAPAPAQWAERFASGRAYLVERKVRIVEDVEFLKVVVATAFEGRLDRVNERVDDYRRLLERRRQSAPQDSPAPAGSPAPGATRIDRNGPTPVLGPGALAQQLLNSPDFGLVKGRERNARRLDGSAVADL